MSKPIDIVMITWHRLEITELVIRTLKANTTTPYRLIVIDNGSPDRMQAILHALYLEGFIDNLTLNEENRGLEPARNQGLELVESDMFVCADNDCLPMKPDKEGDWLSKLVDLMNHYQKYAAISARTQVMIGTGNIFDGREDDDLIQFGHPGGSFRIMRTAETREAGGWRNEVGGRGTEERYICGKLRETGFETGFAVKVKCLHLFGDRAKGTDRWGYPGDWLPDATGHSDIWHPKLESGDDPEEIKEYTDVVLKP